MARGLIRAGVAMGLAAAVGSCAETPIGVSELVRRVTASFAVDRNDARTSFQVRAMRLTERLDDATIDALRGLGAKRETVKALESLRRESAKLPAPAEAPISATPAPGESEQQDMMAKMREYAATYLARLPDFRCTREAQQYFDAELRMRDNRWRSLRSYSAEITYLGGVDQFTGKGSGKQGKATLAPGLWISRGEFGGMMAEIFTPERLAAFHWDHWQMLENRRAAVFSYRVELANSKYQICVNGSGKDDQKFCMVSAHRGFVAIAPENGSILELTLIATDLPAGHYVRAGGHVLDFGPTSIAGGVFLLPKESISYVETGPWESREEIQYSEYHKFASESTVNFDQ